MIRLELADSKTKKGGIQDDDVDDSSSKKFECKETPVPEVTLFITVSRTMEILDGKMEIKNKRCYWCYRTCNGVDIRSSSWRKSIVKGRTIYDMVSAVDALLYKTEKIHILS